MVTHKIAILDNSTMSSGSHTYAFAWKHTMRLCLKSPMEKHSGLGWGERLFGRGKDWLRANFCGAVFQHLICFKNLSDLQRLAQTKAWYCLVKARWFFFFGKTGHSCKGIVQCVLFLSRAVKGNLSVLPAPNYLLEHISIYFKRTGNEL